MTIPVLMANLETPHTEMPSFYEISARKVKVTAHDEEVSAWNDKVSSYNEEVSAC